MARRGLLRNTALTMVALAFVGSVRFIFNFVVARGFDASVLGAANVALSSALIATNLLTAFFGPATSKFLAQYRGAENPASVRRVQRLALTAPLVPLAVVELLAFVYRGALIERLNITPALHLGLCAFIVARTYYMIIRHSYYGMDEVRRYTIAEIVGDVIFTAVLLAITMLSAEPWLLFSYVTGYSVFCLVSASFLLAGRRGGAPNGRRDRDAERILPSYLRFAVIAAVGTVCSTATPHLAQLIAGISFGARSAGVFAVSLSLVWILLFVPTALGMVLLPEFSERYGRRDMGRIRTLLGSTTEGLIPLAVLAVGTVALVPELFLLGFGKDYAVGGPVVRWLLLGIFALIVIRPPVTALAGTKHVLHSNTAGVIVLVVSLVTWRVLLPRFELAGIAAGYSAGQLAGLVYASAAARRFFALDIRRLALRLVRCLLPFLAAVVVLGYLPSDLAIGAVALFWALLIAANLDQARDYRRLLPSGGAEAQRSGESSRME